MEHNRGIKLKGYCDIARSSAYVHLRACTRQRILLLHYSDQRSLVMRYLNDFDKKIKSKIYRMYEVLKDYFKTLLHSYAVCIFKWF